MTTSCYWQLKHELQLFAKELNEALIGKVRGVLGGDEGDLLGENHMVDSYRAIRTDHEWLAVLGVERHVEISTETIGLRRCRRQQDTEFTRHQEKHERSQRDRFE